MLQHYTWMQALFKLCFGSEMLPEDRPSVEHAIAQGMQAQHADARVAHRTITAR